MRSGRGRVVLVVAALSLIFFSLASEAEVCDRTLVPLKGEWHDFRHEEFILQYALNGEHALQESTDSGGGVPDVVADAATQLVAMRDMLTLLNFQLPLQSNRYQEQGAKHILVRFRKLPRLTGRAFDEVRRLPTGECVLIIELASSYRSGNLTPAHELFHQVQNGYTPFKRPWFYEGTARWAETLLGKSTVRLHPVPRDDTARQALWAQSYRAVSTWYGLIKHCGRPGPAARVAVPERIRAMRYRDGRHVLEDDVVLGHEYVRQVLEGLADLGESFANEGGWPPNRWPEAQQRDSRYDAAMWNSVVVTCPEISYQ